MTSTFKITPKLIEMNDGKETKLAADNQSESNIYERF